MRKFRILYFILLTILINGCEKSPTEVVVNKVCYGYIKLLCHHDAIPYGCSEIEKEVYLYSHPVADIDETEMVITSSVRSDTLTLSQGINYIKGRSWGCYTNPDTNYILYVTSNIGNLSGTINLPSSCEILEPEDDDTLESADNAQIIWSKSNRAEWYLIKLYIEPFTLIEPLCISDTIIIGPFLDTIPDFVPCKDSTLYVRDTIVDIDLTSSLEYLQNFPFINFVKVTINIDAYSGPFPHSEEYNLSGTFKGCLWAAYLPITTRDFFIKI
ncbi:hypothetical protein KAX02_07855 [candidate division WOR-3 bacterium]|nr:hypothetical protein [candidate division WOR-3 bacterium]